MGLAKAEDANLDLVEISPNAKPPVCKIMNYGKYRYEAQKKIKAAKKNQKVIHLKEIKLRPNIEQHDYDVKMRASRKFIEAGDKVKVSLRFRGREMAHQNIGYELLKRFAEEISDIAKVEVAPNMEGRQLIMILVGA
jgi:translation initiation factor IF-3